MAFNDTLVVYSDGNPIDVLRACPVLDKPATRRLVERLFPGATCEEIGDELLADALNPPRDVAYVGCYTGLDLVCSWALTPQRPSELDGGVLEAADRRQVLLHAAHSDAGWCSFGLWRDGALIRSLSVRTDPAEPDPAVPDPAVPDPAVPDPAVPDPAVPDPAVPDPAVAGRVPPDRVSADRVSADRVLEDKGEPLPFEDGDDGDLADRSLQALLGFSCAGHDRLDDVDPELIPVVAYRIG